MTKFRVVKIEEQPGPPMPGEVTVPLLEGKKQKLSKEDFKRPDHRYVVTFKAENTGSGAAWCDLVLTFDYMPLLEIGSMYSLEELGNM